MAQRLNDRLTRTAVVPAKGQRIYYDDKIKGFGLRVTAGGAKSFILNYRIKGRERRYTIGAYPAWSVAAARTEAGELRKAIDKGNDPMGERQAEREAPTVTDLCQRYREDHLPRKRESSQRDDKAMLDKIVRPRLGRLKVTEVGFADIDRLHRSLKATPYRANRALALMSKMFSLAIRWGWRADNPCRGVERFQENRRERYLTGEERARLLVAMQEHAAKGKAEARTVDAFRLAMLTGARIGEVFGARWDQIDIGKGLWVKPGATTKQNREHRQILNAPARQLLTEMKPKDGGTWLFPSGKDDHQRSYKHSWASIRKAAGLPDLRVHDLRHNFASEGASIGLSLPMIGALLGHTNPATTARYAHLMDDPLRQAAERIGSRLTADEGRESA